MDSKNSGFKKIEAYCNNNGEGRITHYIAYCIYKQQFLDVVEGRVRQSGKDKLPAKEFEQCKKDFLTEEQIKHYVRESEELLQEMVSTYQETLLKEHHQELKQDLERALIETVQRGLKKGSGNGFWKEALYSVSNNIISNLIAWLLLIIGYMYAKKYIAGFLNTLNINI